MIDASPTLADAAHAYAARGWRVHPARTRDKRPLVDAWQHAATTDPDIITAWWAEWPNANIAIATGTESGIVVVDIDGPTGEHTLDELLAEHGLLPETLTALTGGDGQHFVFAHPGGGELRNTAGRLGPGIDTRGDGGYIIAPPSIHPNGQRYDWLDPDTPPAPLPAWIAAAITTEKPSHASAGIRPPHDYEPSSGTTRYAQVALDARAAEVAGAPKGQRNSTLNDAAFRMGQLVAGGQIDDQHVIDALSDNAIRAGLPVGETMATIRSGLGAGAREPQYPDPARTISSPDRARTRQPEGERPTDLRPPDPVEPTVDNSAAPTADASTPDDTHGTPPPTGARELGDDDQPEPDIKTSDLGNAIRLIRDYGHELRYARHRTAWLRWDGRRWAVDDNGHVDRCAHATAQQILHEALLAEDADDRKKLIAHSLKSENARQIENMMRVAESLAGVSVTAELLDANPWALNVLNGTIDLRTGELTPHHPADLITKLAPVRYDPDAHDDRWDAYLRSALADDDLADWLARAVGYTLTGDTSEEVLFFVHGPTRAGKSTFLEAIKNTFGDYSRNAEWETFLDRDHGGGARPDIARLAGARLVTSNEVDEGRRLAEGLVKTLTGGDTITARFLYRDEFEYLPQFKLWLAANHKPKVRHGDDAIWRRIRLVPFVHPPEHVDPSLKKHLSTNPNARTAILAWAIRGCTSWQRNGLRTVDAVTAATEAYRAEMDPLAEFFADHCAFGTEDYCWVRAASLRSAYEEWAKEQGIRHTLSSQAFRELLEDRGADSDRRRIDGKTTRVWTGVRLLDVGEEPKLFPENTSRPSREVTPVTERDNRDNRDATSRELPYARARREEDSETPSRASRASRGTATTATPPAPTSSGSSPVGEDVVVCAQCGGSCVASPGAVALGWATVCGACSRAEEEAAKANGAPPADVGGAVEQRFLDELEEPF